MRDNDATVINYSGFAASNDNNKNCLSCCHFLFLTEEGIDIVINALVRVMTDAKCVSYFQIIVQAI